MRVETFGDATLYLGDCLDIMPTIGKVDAVITDPPYGIDGTSGNINKKRGKGEYEKCFIDNREYIENVVVRCIKICIEKSECCILTPGNKNFILYPQPDSFGCFYQPASVGLQSFGNADSQPIFYYGKNLTRKNMGKPCSYQLIESPEVNGHPCVKPLRIWMKLLSNNTMQNMLILDPFMGSGTTGVAALQLDRKFIGIEKEPKYFDIACKRIDAESRKMKLL